MIKPFCLIKVYTDEEPPATCERTGDAMLDSGENRGLKMSARLKNCWGEVEGSARRI